ncbi:cupin domain-containing protein [Candidatus Aenigmatarchaeota archaeon]
MKSAPIITPPASKNIKSGRVFLHPGEEIGEHVTKNREEIIIILKGTATITDGDKNIVKAGETYFVKEDVKHNVKNESDQNLEYIYVVSLF